MTLPESIQKRPAKAADVKRTNDDGTPFNTKQFGIARCYTCKQLFWKPDALERLTGYHFCSQECYLSFQRDRDED